MKFLNEMSSRFARAFYVQDRDPFPMLLPSTLEMDPGQALRAFRDDRIGFGFLLFFSIFIICLSFLAPLPYNWYFGQFDANKILVILYLDLYAALTLFFTPYLAGVKLLRFSPGQLGLTWPHSGWRALVDIIIALALLIPWILWFLARPEFQSAYRHDAYSLTQFLLLQVVLTPAYYFCEEFFFRGVLFKGFLRNVGWHSFWITDILFTYAHLGKPLIEIGMAIPASVVLNLLTLRNSSIYPAIVVHSTMGIVMNTVLYFHWL